jgi:RNA polymerase sigma-70 factor (ECF subfamily)
MVTRPLQEKILLYQVRTRKDPDAYAKIYDLYVRRIYRFVYFKVSSEEEAQDLTADVFLKAWQYLLLESEEKGKEVRYLGAMLYGIAKNRVIDHYRSKAHRDTVPMADDAGDKIADERHLQDVTEAKIDVQFLEKHLRSLKDEYREVLVMKYLDELGTGEIAKFLDKTPGNVRVLLHRATNALKEIIHVESQHRGTTEDTPT